MSTRVDRPDAVARAAVSVAEGRERFRTSAGEARASLVGANPCGAGDLAELYQAYRDRLLRVVEARDEHLGVAEQNLTRWRNNLVSVEEQNTVEHAAPSTARRGR